MDIDGPGRRLLDLFHPLHCAWQNEVVHFADTGWQIVAKFCGSRDFLVRSLRMPWKISQTLQEHLYLNPLRYM